MDKPVVIAVAGGSGSGKTTIARALADRFGSRSVALIEQDYYYNDQTAMTMEERLAVNYDHPDAFDFALLAKQLARLTRRCDVELPQYDYAAYNRAGFTKHQPAADVIILEGILALYDETVAQLADIRIYVDTAADLRFIRRLQRDVGERGRTLASVVAQYVGQVRPMHEQFVEPTKRRAHLIIPCNEANEVAADVLTAKIAAVLQARSI